MTRLICSQIRRLLAYSPTARGAALPASVIRSEVNSRIQEIQTGQGRRVQRKERLDIVDEVTQDLMPRAFTKSQHLEALINDREGWCG